MGLIVLPIAFVVAIGWVALFVLAGALAASIVRSLGFGNIHQIVAIVFVLSLGIYLPNADGINKKIRLNKVAQDCGWRIFGTVSDVSTIYVEPPTKGYSSLRTYAVPFLSFYKSIEFQDVDGRYRQEQRGWSKNEEQYTTNRVSRFGVRYSYSMATPDIHQDKLEILDLEKNELLGQHIAYYYSPREESIFDIAISLLRYSPKRCGEFDNSSSFLKRVSQIVVPSTVQTK